MKKFLVVILLTIMLIIGGLVPQYSNAVDIIITIPTDDVVRAKAGFLKIYPNSGCAVVNEENSDICDTPMTDIQWIKDVVRRFIVNSIRRGEREQAQEEAISVLSDPDNIIQ